MAAASFFGWPAIVSPAKKDNADSATATDCPIETQTLFAGTPKTKR